ncbi:PREDICTED: translation initiation factor IF-2-like [Lepidothrix coronata]|uniref:Translation initiation factor IF-2-like n=1 Tax=Lepidothrix coronata TaxID=321398 RepID=A0A6J0IT21_9PASS|nr:PREDICTED: translation initiation factor IF-2-like [Lepidothrix coronata]
MGERGERRGGPRLAGRGAAANGSAGPRIWPAWPPTAAAALGAKEEKAEALQCQPSAPKLWLLLSPDHEPLEPDEDRACQGASAGILEFLQTPNTPPILSVFLFPHLLGWAHSPSHIYSAYGCPAAKRTVTLSSLISITPATLLRQGVAAAPSQGAGWELGDHTQALVAHSQESGGKTKAQITQQRQNKAGSITRERRGGGGSISASDENERAQAARVLLPPSLCPADIPASRLNRVGSDSRRNRAPRTALGAPWRPFLLPAEVRGGGAAGPGPRSAEQRQHGHWIPCTRAGPRACPASSETWPGPTPRPPPGSGLGSCLGGEERPGERAEAPGGCSGLGRPDRGAGRRRQGEARPDRSGQGTDRPQAGVRGRRRRAAGAGTGGGGGGRGPARPGEAVAAVAGGAEQPQDGAGAAAAIRQ